CPIERNLEDSIASCSFFESSWFRSRVTACAWCGKIRVCLCTIFTARSATTCSRRWCGRRIRRRSARNARAPTSTSCCPGSRCIPKSGTGRPCVTRGSGRSRQTRTSSSRTRSTGRNTRGTELMNTCSRRSWLQASVVGPVGAAVWHAAALAMAQGATGARADVSHVKALVFDVFGTVVDWRTAVAREVDQLARRKKFTVDGAKFADAWRAGYGPSMNRVRTGELPWTRLDDLHRMTLDKILGDFNITSLSAAEKDDLNRAWHRLDPWPDSVAGLTRLKQRFIIAPLSNGNIALMTD